MQSISGNMKTGEMGEKSLYRVHSQKARYDFNQRKRIKRGEGKLKTQGPKIIEHIGVLCLKHTRKKWET